MSLSHEKHPMIFKILKILPAFVLRIPTFDSAAEPNLAAEPKLARVFGIGSTLAGVAVASAAASADNTVIIIEKATSPGEAISSGVLKISSGVLRKADQYEESSNAGDEA